MPARFTVDPNKNSVSLQFTDANGNPVAEPAGATVEWSVDNDGVATVTANPNNPLEGDINVVNGGAARLTATVTGANDVNSQPFDPVSMTIQATPAQPARILFGSN